MTDQLKALVRRFPSRYVHTNPSGGGSYVGHEVVVQRLLHAVGPFSTQMVELLRGDVPGIAPNPTGRSDRARNGAPGMSGVVVGVVLRLTLEVDGRTVSVEEVGDCESPHNWPHDGARAKDAFSDAIKRAAMRCGVAIHLWAQDEFFIDAALEASAPSVGEGGS